MREFKDSVSGKDRDELPSAKPDDQPEARPAPATAEPTEQKS
jgi:hypothetical protein